MKEKPSSSLEEDTEEMMEWRSMSQEELDPRWKKLAEKMEEEVWDKYKVEDSKREAQRQRLLLWNGGVYEQEVQDTKVGRRLLGKNLRSCSENTTCSVGKACMKIPRKKKR